MGIHVFDHAEALGEHAAQIVVDAIAGNPAVAIGLATGSSPIVVYNAWAKLAKARGIDTSRVRGFALDEYVGLPENHPESYHRVIERTVIEPIGLTPELVRVLDGNGDVDAECTSFEAAIQAAGGIGVQLLGIGRNGHLAFNEPGSAFDSRTRSVELSPETILDNARFFDQLQDVPTRAITQGLGTILESKRILVIATGSAKADAVAAALEGPLTVDCPASVLRNHASVEWYLDRDAAAKLGSRSLAAASTSVVGE